MTPFNGLGMHLGNLARLSRARTRSISPENFTGEKGKGGMATDGTGAACARDLGVGWKISPSIRIAPGETRTLADVRGSCAFQHIWMTLTGQWHRSILRIYWDDQETPSVECPTGDFFACGWGQYARISSLAVCELRQCVQLLPGNALPERVSHDDDEYRRAGDDALLPDHLRGDRCPRRSGALPRPVSARQPAAVQKGQGQYVGAYMAWGVNNNGWWGEGEIKFYIDGDDEYPTICGTGTEDYFCGSYNFDVGKDQGGYREFTTPYSGLAQVIRPDGLYRSQMRFGMYRWHITDPFRFERNLRVTIQALDWRSGGQYLPLQDDIASVAYWYQTLPTAPFPPLPDADYLEVI